MTALVKPRLPLSTDFGDANSSAQGSRVFKPVTSVRRAQKNVDFIVILTHFHYCF
jgi:hypothetical protein